MTGDRFQVDRHIQIQNLVDIDQYLANIKLMLEGVFGNKTAEKVLLHIYHYIRAFGTADEKNE